MNKSKKLKFSPNNNLCEKVDLQIIQSNLSFEQQVDNVIKGIYL